MGKNGMQKLYCTWKQYTSGKSLTLSFQEARKSGSAIA